MLIMSIVKIYKHLQPSRRQVLHLEDERFGTFFDDVANKGNDQLTVLVLETVNKHLLDV